MTPLEFSESVPQYGAPLTDESRVIIYDRYVFVKHATVPPTRVCFTGSTNTEKLIVQCFHFIMT
jgi:hypothetical protein